MHRNKKKKEEEERKKKKKKKRLNKIKKAGGKMSLPSISDKQTGQFRQTRHSHSDLELTTDTEAIDRFKIPCCKTTRYLLSFTPTAIRTHHQQAGR